MNRWEAIAGITESFATAIALIVAGVWTYLTYVRQRLKYPRLDISISTQVVPIAQGKMLRAQVTLQNHGTVVVISNFADLRLRQVVPMPPNISELVRSGYDPVPADCAQIEWPLIVSRQWKWPKGAFEIEPGESDALCADFFISDEPQVVEIYFYIANAKKKRQNIGWTMVTILELSTREAYMSGKAGSESTVKVTPTVQPQPFQQRPIEPQTQQQPRQPQQQQQTKVRGK